MNIENNKLNWNEILEQEDRLIRNSDRKYNNHCCSLEAISEECIYNLHKEQYDNSAIEEIMKYDFVLSIINENLLKKFNKLSTKQKAVIRLYFWYGYNQREIADILGCSFQAVSYLINRALILLK